MIAIAVVGQKGGVGKTITVANLGTAFAEHGRRVLLVDFDPQADLSASCGGDDDDPRPRIERSLISDGVDVRDALVAVALDGGGRLALLPTAYEALRRQTARLLAGDHGELARLLAQLDGDFDIALIDTPAGDTVFGRQALVAADAAIVPVLPGYHELRALARGLELLDEGARADGSAVALLGVLVVNADPRWRTTREYGAHLAALAAADELALFETSIPRHQPVTGHARLGRPTVVVSPRCSVAVAYRELAVEVEQRIPGADG